MEEPFNVEQAIDDLRVELRALAVQTSALLALARKSSQGSGVRGQGRFISFDQGAELLGISASSIRKRKCGTEDLHHVRQGERVLLVRSEVERLAVQRISEATTPRERAAKKLRSA